MVVRFLKGVVCPFPPVKEVVSLWDLNTMLATLMRSPFEPLEACLCPKASFSYCYNMCKESKWPAGPTGRASVYAIFQKQSRPKFLSKAMSHFHLNQTIYLLVLFRKPHSNADEQHLHTLGLRQSLAFYLKRIKPFCSLPWLLVSSVDWMRSQMVLDGLLPALWWRMGSAFWHL